jgi:hypothetical protein
MEAGAKRDADSVVLRASARETDNMCRKIEPGYAPSRGAGAGARADADAFEACLFEDCRHEFERWIGDRLEKAGEGELRAYAAGVAARGEFRLLCLLQVLLERIRREDAAGVALGAAVVKELETIGSPVPFRDFMRVSK